MIFLLGFVVAACCSLILTPLVARLGRRAGVVDVSGGRRIHEGEVPRVGGISIAIATALTLIAILTFESAAGVHFPNQFDLVPILLGALVVFALGLYDDIHGITPGRKLLGQAAAATVIIAFGVTIDRVTILGTVYEFGWLGVPLTLMWIVGITNAFNLVDGLDGLAGGLVCIAAVTCATVLLARGDLTEGLLLVAVVGAVAGFLPYNLNPAVVFLGDSGSLLCGFLLAVTAIAGRQKGATALAVGVPLLIFALPITDTVLAIGRRLARSQRQNGVTAIQRLRRLSRVLMADQEHIHHRLLAIGLSQRMVVLVLYALAILCSALALATMEVS